MRNAEGVVPYSNITSGGDDVVGGCVVIPPDGGVSVVGGVVVPVPPLPSPGNSMLTSGTVPDNPLQSHIILKSASKSSALLSKIDALRTLSGGQKGEALIPVSEFIIISIWQSQVCIGTRPDIK